MRFIALKQYHHRPVTHRNRFFLAILPVIVIGLFLIGCTAVGPDYTKVEPDAPTKWHTELSGGLSAKELQPETLAHWWTTPHAA